MTHCSVRCGVHTHLSRHMHHDAQEMRSTAATLASQHSVPWQTLKTITTAWRCVRWIVVVPLHTRWMCEPRYCFFAGIAMGGPDPLSNRSARCVTILKRYTNSVAPGVLRVMAHGTCVQRRSMDSTCHRDPSCIAHHRAPPTAHPTLHWQRFSRSVSGWWSRGHMRPWSRT